MTGIPLIGRDAEVQALAELMEHAAADGGQCLVIRGDPGIGKTSLLRAARDSARRAGLHILSAAGVESEAQLPFAGLHQVLRPLLASVTLQPEGHQQALRIAFGLAEGDPPELFGVALAALRLIAAAAADRPVAILIDDVQWLDAQSQDALTFIAHRRAECQLAIVVTVRIGYPGPFVSAGLPELMVRGVSNDAAGEILRTVAGVATEADRRQIRDHAQGNPLALLELPALLTTSQADSPDWQPITARLERAFGSRVAGLGAATRDALLVAATDPVEDIAEILHATSALRRSPTTIEALTPAIEAELVHVEGGVLGFRHPLVRSGILQAETLTRRQAANAALADVLSDDRYRRAWHRAQSIVGPDDKIADELEESAAVALGRGAVMSAISVLRRSAQLTSSPARRGHRLLVAAEHAFGMGRESLVRELVTAAERLNLSDLDWARAQWLREIFNDGVPGDAVRVHQLCDVARGSAAAGDRDLALNLLLGAALRCVWADTGPAARADVAAATKALPDASGGGPDVTRDPRYAAALALAEPVLECGTVLELLSELDPATVTDGDALRVLGLAATAIGDPVGGLALHGRAEELLRRQGRLALLSQVLSMGVLNRLWVGEWDAAEAAASEGERLAIETGQAVWRTGALAISALSSALRGNADQALMHAAEVETAASRHRLNLLLSIAQTAKGVALSSIGQHDEAYRELSRAFRSDDPSFHHRERFGAIMFLAEAAVAAGEVADAREIVAGLDQVAARTPSPLLDVYLLYARALLCDDNAAGSLYSDLMSKDLSGWPWVRACASLAYGSWLRRRGRRAEAVAALRSATARLDRIGAGTWADRARDELRAARGGR